MKLQNPLNAVLCPLLIGLLIGLMPGTAEAARIDDVTRGSTLAQHFTVEAVSQRDGRSMVILRVGHAKHSALIKVPPGHLAIVRRADELPKDVRACAAKLAKFDGPISPKARRLMAELARRS